MRFDCIEYLLIWDEYLLMTTETMSQRRSSGSKVVSQELNWDEIEDPDCVAESGWQDECKTAWTCTTCKTYVKMKHLAKLWQPSQAKVSIPQ
jgi:hypothetical protein